MLTLYKNSGLFCAQACMKIILKHYFPKKKFSLQKLSKLTYKRRNGATYTLGVVLALDKLGLKTKYYTKTKLNKKHKQHKLIQKYCKKYLLSEKTKEKLIQEIKKKKLVTVKKLKLTDLKKFLKKNYLIILLLNWALIKNKKKYIGHFVILNKIDSRVVSVINVGPKEASVNYKIPLKKLNKAWHSRGTDSDVIVIYGKK